MNLAQAFLEDYLQGPSSSFEYVPSASDSEIAGNTGATWMMRGTGGMSLGELRSRLRQAQELKRQWAAEQAWREKEEARQEWWPD